MLSYCIQEAINIIIESIKNYEYTDEYKQNIINSLIPLYKTLFTLNAKARDVKDADDVKDTIKNDIIIRARASAHKVFD